MRKFNALFGGSEEQWEDELGDGELIARVRAGDNNAFGVLFDRHHAAAERMARRVAPPAETDDLVSESFLQLFLQLQNGAGPDLAFRAYLFTSIRNLAMKYARARDRIRPMDDATTVDPVLDLADTALTESDHAMMRDAFASLPERWRLVLWQLEVEREKPRDIAVSLGMKPNSVSALAHRARAGLRDHYLQHHLKLQPDAIDIDCQYARSHLAVYVRSAIVRRGSARISQHLEECVECARIHAELKEVDSRLGGVVLPVVAAGLVGGVAGLGDIAVGIDSLAVGVQFMADSVAFWLLAYLPALTALLPTTLFGTMELLFLGSHGPELAVEPAAMPSSLRST